MILTGEYTEHHFYNGEVLLRYYPDPIHAYFLVEGETLTKQDGVTTICKIIDKSNALVPWACKMMYEKLMRILPVAKGDKDLDVSVKPISLAEFEKLAIDAKSAHKEKLEEAGDIGSMAHDWLEQYIKVKLGVLNTEDNFLAYPENEKVLSCVQAALDWERRHNVRWISTEQKVYSRQFSFAGTMDGTALTDACDDVLCCSLPCKDHRSLIDWKSSNYLYIEHLYQTAAYQHAHEEEFPASPFDDRWIIRLGKEDGKFDPWHCDRTDYTLDWLGFQHALDLSRAHAEITNRMKKRRDYIRDERKRAATAVKAEIKAAAKLAKAEAKEKAKAEKIVNKAKKKLDNGSVV